MAFETSDANTGRWEKPVRVPAQKRDIFEAAREMCADLDGWKVVGVDEGGLSISCERDGGVLGGRSVIHVRVEGPDGIPSSTTFVSSESKGGLWKRDRRNVAEFVKKFTMRVC